MDYNSVTLVGRCARDPELKHLQSGTAVCEFSIAVNDRYKKGDEWVDSVSFFDVSIFGKPAEAVNETVQKGSKIMVAGKLKQESWEKDGQKRSKVKVAAAVVELCGATVPRQEKKQEEETPW